MARVGQTGGLGWHLKAWRYRQRLWAGYLQRLAAAGGSRDPAGKVDVHRFQVAAAAVPPRFTSPPTDE